jgi:hypothetical protein
MPLPILLFQLQKIEFGAQNRKLIKLSVTLALNEVGAPSERERRGQVHRITQFKAQKPKKLMVVAQHLAKSAADTGVGGERRAGAGEDCAEDV